MVELNRVFIAGNLTSDPELKYIPSGTAVCEMRIASNRRFVDKTSGERRDDALFINVTAWGRTAENCNQYLKKGRPILVEGRIKQDTWKDNDGNNRERISIVADRVHFLGSRQDGDGGGGNVGRGAADPTPASASAARGPDPNDEGGTTDDLPF
jgi:single-strand DNA-binding protein